jgi:acetyl-CoA carboxylase carboxyltransferase component
MIGVEAEKEGTIRFGARFIFAVYQATVPWCSIILRRVFGVAGAAHGNHSRLNLRYGWPSGDWGSLPIEGGVQAAYRRQIEAAEDPQALRVEIELIKVTSPFSRPKCSGSRRLSIRATQGRYLRMDRNRLSLLPSELGPKNGGCDRGSA